MNKTNKKNADRTFVCLACTVHVVFHILLSSPFLVSLLSHVLACTPHVSHERRLIPLYFPRATLYSCVYVCVASRVPGLLPLLHSHPLLRFHLHLLHAVPHVCAFVIVCVIQFVLLVMLVVAAGERVDE